MLLMNLAATDNRPLYIPRVAIGRKYRGLPDAPHPTDKGPDVLDREDSDIPPDSKPSEKMKIIQIQ